jgi:hypothetical protein
MSSVLLFDIITQIIDIVGENEDINLLKELALVSHSFHQNCSKHLFATVELRDADPIYHVASSKKKFVKLLESRPDVVKYIRKLTYIVGYVNPFQSLQSSSTYPNFVNDDHLLSPILPDFLRTIPHLNCLTISASKFDWNSMDSSLTSALLHLMRLPTMNHIDLSYIQNFPLYSLTSSVNLHRLKIFFLSCDDTLEEDGSPELVVQSETMPKIREFDTYQSSLLTTKLLDGRPAFNFTDLRRLSMSFTQFDDERNLRHLLQNTTLLEELSLIVGLGPSLVGLHDILSPSARTSLKVLDLSVRLPLTGLCEELDAMTGHNILEVLSFALNVNGHEIERATENSIGSIIQKLEGILVKPGWSALRQVSFDVSIACCQASLEDSEKLTEALQSLPDKYLSHLSKLESVAFNYSASFAVFKCASDHV